MKDGKKQFLFLRLNHGISRFNVVSYYVIQFVTGLMSKTMLVFLSYIV